MLKMSHIIDFISTILDVNAAHPALRNLIVGIHSMYIVWNEYDKFGERVEKVIPDVVSELIMRELFDNERTLRQFAACSRSHIAAYRKIRKDFATHRRMKRTIYGKGPSPYSGHRLSAVTYHFVENVNDSRRYGTQIAENSSRVSGTLIAGDHIFAINGKNFVHYKRIYHYNDDNIMFAVDGDGFLFSRSMDNILLVYKSQLRVSIGDKQNISVLEFNDMSVSGERGNPPNQLILKAAEYLTPEKIARIDEDIDNFNTDL